MPDVDLNLSAAIEAIESNSFDGVKYNNPEGLEVSGKQFAIVRISNYATCESYSALVKFIERNGGIVKADAIKNADYAIVTPSPVSEYSMVYVKEKEKYEKAVKYNLTENKPLLIRDVDFYILNNMFSSLSINDKRRVVLEYVNGNPNFIEKSKKTVVDFINKKASEDLYLKTKSEVMSRVGEVCIASPDQKSSTTKKEALTKNTQNSDKEKFLEYVKNNDIAFSNVEITEKTKNVLHINNKTSISDIVLLSNEEICKFKSIDKESAIEIVKCKNEYLREHKTAIVEYAIGTKLEENLAIKEISMAESKKIYTLEKYDDKVAITGYKGEDVDVVIPEKIGGNTVDLIDDAAFSPEKPGYLNSGLRKEVKASREKLKSVVIPDTVTSIGEGAFYECKNLTKITMGNGVTDIKNMAFYGCEKLEVINISDSVTSLGEYVFNECTKLTSITIPAGVISIPKRAFADCKNLTAVNVSYGLKNIKTDAFSCCSSLETIIIPDSVTTIGVGAFLSCTSLKTITIGQNVTSLGNRAFCNCKNLETIIIPKSVKKFGEDVFSGCKKLTICAQIGSFAEQYAKENNISFKPI